MNVKRMVDEIRVAMLSDFGRMSEENLMIYCDLAEKYSGALRALADLRDARVGMISNAFDEMKETVYTTYEKATSAEEILSAYEKAYMSEEVESTKLAEGTYMFIRELRGGYLEGLEKGFVPENVVRSLELVTGDVVKAELAGEGKYRYSVAEKRATLETNESRVEFRYCPVESHEGFLVVTKSLLSGESVLEDGGMIRLATSDVSRLNVSVDDIVDIAFDSNDPEVARIIYKNVTGAGIRFSIPKKNKKQKQVVKKPSVTSDTLKGFKILILGNEYDRLSYQKEIEGRSGVYEWISPDVNSTVLEAAVKRSHLVVAMKGYISHDSSGKAKTYCKRHGVNFRCTTISGPTRLGKYVETTCKQLFKPKEVVC